MEKTINMISEYVFEGKEVPEELLYEFSEEVTRIIEGRGLEDIPDEFWKLENYVELYWRGGKFAYEEDPARVFQMGQLLSYTNLINIWFEKMEKDISLEEYARIYGDKYLFFKSIHDEYGITHKELASKLQMSTSALSQFVNRIKGKGFFISRAMGREKHYYLTDKGEKLLKIMLTRKAHFECNYTELLGAWNNFNKIITNDRIYQVVGGNTNVFLTKNMYLKNKIDNFNGYASISKDNVNRKELYGNYGVERWKKKVKTKMFSKIS